MNSLQLNSEEDLNFKIQIEAKPKQIKQNMQCEILEPTPQLSILDESPQLRHANTGNYLCNQALAQQVGNLTELNKSIDLKTFISLS